MFYLFIYVFIFLTEGIFSPAYFASIFEQCVILTTKKLPSGESFLRREIILVQKPSRYFPDKKYTNITLALLCKKYM